MTHFFAPLWSTRQVLDRELSCYKALSLGLVKENKICGKFTRKKDLVTSRLR